MEERCTIKTNRKRDRKGFVRKIKIINGKEVRT